MTREEKSLVIEELTAQLADNVNIYLADISGLNALDTSNLRSACFKGRCETSSGQKYLP
jgi:large subunit ribosomal protein L10